MEGDRSGAELVKAAFAKDRVEAEMIHGLLENAGIPSLLEPAGLNVDGPQLGFGLASQGFGGGPQRVMVHAGRADEARALLEETLVEDDEESPEVANTAYLEAANAGRARSYGVVGAYARAIPFSFAMIAVAFGAFLLLRAL
jgi:hypothetical protein